MMKILKLINFKRLLKLKRKQRIRLVIGLFVILPPALLIVPRYPKEAEATWWDDNWHYRIKTIISNAGSTQTDFQISISLDTATAITYGKMQSDCDDMRIANSERAIINDPYWIESCNVSITTTNASEVDFDEALQNGVTFTSWIYANSDGENDTGEIFDKGSATFCRTDSKSEGSLDLQCSLDLASGGSDASLNISSVLSTNTWHHIAMTYSDDGDDEIIVYGDGVSRGASTDGSGAPQSTDTNDLIIGGDSSNNFDGQIDDFRVYNYALSVAQIKKVMNNTSQRFDPETGAL